MSKERTQTKQAPAPDIRISSRVSLKLKRRVARISRNTGLAASDVVRIALRVGLVQFEQTAG